MHRPLHFCVVAFAGLASRATQSAGLPILLGTATATWAQTPSTAGYEPASAVAVVVKVPKPWYAPKSVVVSRMRDSVPQYESIAGLSFKAFSLDREDGQYGGLYLWKSAAAASAFFGPAWFERVEKERGAKADVRFFEVPVAIDNVAGGTPFASDSAAVGTLVTVATPVGTPKARVIEVLKASVPVYRQVPGLMRKYFVLSGDGRFGGIYLWKDMTSAQAFLNEAWKQRVRTTYGSDASVEWFDTPILLPSKLADNRIEMPGLQ